MVDVLIVRPTRRPPRLVMKFRILHDSLLVTEGFPQHSIWARYHEPADVAIISSWGLPTAEVEDALRSVDWSDEYCFPVLRPADAPRFYDYYAAAAFRIPSGLMLSGAVSAQFPDSLWIFHGDTMLLLTPDDPELSEEDETTLIAACGGDALFPLTVESCALPLPCETVTKQPQQSNGANKARMDTPH